MFLFKSGSSYEPRPNTLCKPLQCGPGTVTRTLNSQQSGDARWHGRITCLHSGVLKAKSMWSGANTSQDKSASELEELEPESASISQAGSGNGSAAGGMPQFAEPSPMGPGG
jgi:hypothetical protein